MSSGPSLPAAPKTPYQFGSMPGADVGAYTGATNIGTQGQNINQAYDAAGSRTGAANLTQTAGSTLPYVGSALTTAFDPQSALYARQFQQQQDQTRAALAAQGTAGTPYGAGIETQNNENFNQDWLNQLVGRQATGASTASTLLGGAGSGLATGTGVGQSIAQLPINIQQMSVQDLLSYLGLGTGAANAATGLYGAETGAALGQQQLNASALGGLGSLLGTGTLAGALLL